MEITNILRENIRILLTDNNVNQSELAKVLAVSNKIVSNWLTGTSQIPLDKLVLISEYFKIDLDKLVKTPLGRDYGQYTDFIKQNHPEILQEKSVEYKTLPIDDSILLNDEKVTNLATWLLKNDAKLMENHFYNLYISSKQKEYLDFIIKNNLRNNLLGGKD